MGRVKTRRRLHELPRDPEASARIAGLQYTSDRAPGIKRIPHGTGFRYVDPNGKPIRDKKTITRIHDLVLPPAWMKVWICPDPSGHLQAVGFDAKGRKQYRYHSAYRALRNLTKFHCMPEIVSAIEKVRQRLPEHLALPGMPREKVLAALVRLLDSTGIRVGNEASATENKTFGLTTLQNRHVEIEGATLVFRFTGKSGVKHELKITDRRLAHIVRQCHDLPGHKLFEYVDEAGELRGVSSTDVNSYLSEISAQNLTAKDFRTWGGTVECATALRDIGEFSSDTEGKKNVVSAIKSAAARLGNRVATCRTYYVHPAVPESYLSGELLPVMREGTSDPEGSLSCEERAVLTIVKQYRRQIVESAPVAICA